MAVPDDRSGSGPRVRLPRGTRRNVLSAATLAFAVLIAFLVWGVPGALAAAGALILVWAAKPDRGPEDAER